MTDREKIKKVFRMLRKEGFPVLFSAATSVDTETSLLTLNGHLTHTFNEDGSIKHTVFYSWEDRTKEGIKCAQLFVAGLLEEGFEVTNQKLDQFKAIGIRTKGDK